MNFAHVVHTIMKQSGFITQHWARTIETMNYLICTARNRRHPNLRIAMHEYCGTRVASSIIHLIFLHIQYDVNNIYGETKLYIQKNSI